MAETPSIIQGALAKVLGLTSTPSAGTADSGVSLAPKNPISYIGGAFDAFGKDAGGMTQKLSNTVAQPVAAAAVPDYSAYTKYGSAMVDPFGQVRVGNYVSGGPSFSINTKDPNYRTAMEGALNKNWSVVNNANRNDPQVQAALQRSLAESQGIVSNLSAMNVPGNPNYNNPNLGIQQQRVNAFNAYLNPLK